jgi:hypothetical protein
MEKEPFSPKSKSERLSPSLQASEPTSNNQLKPGMTPQQMANIISNKLIEVVEKQLLIKDKARVSGK